MPGGESWQRGYSEISPDITGSIASWSWAKRGVVFFSEKCLWPYCSLNFQCTTYCRLLADGAQMALQSWGAQKSTFRGFVFCFVKHNYLTFIN